MTAPLYLSTAAAIAWLARFGVVTSRSVIEYRCTVCGEKTPASDRWWFCLGNTLPGWAFATTEAPVHRACADLALKVCPHLRTLGHGPVRWNPPTAVVSAIIGGPATDRDFGVNLNGGKIVGHLKFVWRFTPPSMRGTVVAG